MHAKLYSNWLYFLFDFYYINYLVAPISFTLSCIFVFKNLIKHRLDLASDKSTFSSFLLVASKHQDLYIPPLVFTVLTSPYFILDKSVTCATADTKAVARMLFFFRLLGNSGLGLTFIMYVYLSNVYINEFWNASFVGHGLLYVKKRIKHCTRYDSSTQLTFWIKPGTQYKFSVPIICPVRNKWYTGLLSQTMFFHAPEQKCMHNKNAAKVLLNWVYECHKRFWEKLYQYRPV